MKLAVFIDYDNLLEGHRSTGILDVTTKVLLQTPFLSASPLGDCDVRIYGGWFEGPTMTRLAQDLTVAIANEFPAIIRIPSDRGEILSLRTNAALAMSMIEEPGHPLLNTYRKKGRPANLRVQQPATVGCSDSSCPLPIAKKLLKTGSCPSASCAIPADDLVYRHEQKIVDTMLTCDMLYAPTQNYRHLILVSGDDDFLPPVRALILRGIPVARFHPRPNRARPKLSIPGGHFTDSDL